MNTTIDEDTAEHAPFQGSLWAVPAPARGDLTADINRVDYWIDRVEQAADHARRAADEFHQACNRYKAATRRDPDNRRYRSVTRAGFFGGGIASGVVVVWLARAAGVMYVAGWQL